MKPDQGVFDVNKKTIFLLSTTLILFANGFGRIDFFFAGAASFALQFLLDRIYITYWYNPKSSLSDPTNSSTISILRYAPAIYLAMGFYVLKQN